jgi:Polyphosphate kinase 2 (PPK2)
MPRKEIIDRIEKYVHPFRITKGNGFKLIDFDPGDTCGLIMRPDKGEAADLLQRGTVWLAEEQDMLYAQKRWSLLLVFQAMDAAGKDGTIKHVMSGVNPQGCQVFSFKQPSSEGVTSSACPSGDGSGSSIDPTMRKSRCACARSYLETTEAAFGAREQAHPAGAAFRYRALRGLPHSIILKFFLNLSRKERKKRFMERLDRSDKHWKFSTSDVHERRFWGDHMRAFEEAIRATASKRAPWYVVPADNKWFTRLVVAAAIVEAVEKLDLAYPAVDAEKKRELQRPVQPSAEKGRR